MVQQTPVAVAAPQVGEMLRFQIDSRCGSEECVIDALVCTVGRADDCVVALPQLTDLSRHHFRLVLEGATLRVEDVGSRHGTFVRGQRVGSAPLQVGDVVQAGGLKLTVLEFCAAQDNSAEGTAVMPGAMVRRHGGVDAVEALAADTFPEFRLLRCIGAGGMGVVYAAEEIGPIARLASAPSASSSAHAATQQSAGAQQPQRQVALKVLRPQLAASDIALQEFFEEMRILAGLDHPGIVRFLGHGRANGLHYLIMELVEGETAREKLRRGGPLPWREAMQIAYEVTRSLLAAWRHHRVVHGDIKPANMLLTSQGATKLCDFGLSQVSKAQARTFDVVSRNADRRGTAAYSAPELFTGTQPRSVAADIYALGISLFQLISGRLPFEQLEVAALRAAHASQPLPSLAALRPDLPAAVPALIEHMCAKDPARRHRDHDELLSDLDLLR